MVEVFNEGAEVDFQNRFMHLQLQLVGYFVEMEDARPLDQHDFVPQAVQQPGIEQFGCCLEKVLFDVKASGRR